MSRTRTDVHSPSNLVTEDYDFAYAYDAHPTEGFRPIGALQALLAEGWHFGQVHGGDTCDHCGARLRYVAVLQHAPSHTLIKVGEQCLENRFERASAEFHSLRKNASLNREQSRKADRIAALVDAHPLLAWLTYSGDVLDNDFLNDVSFRFVNKGELSEKQIAAVEKAIIRDTERRMEREAKKAAEAAAIAAGTIEAVPATDKRIQITGEVISQRTQESQFGTQFRMLVKDDRGFKVWGTEPSSINPVVGSRVTFIAKVERSNDDPQFGFFSRPTKAEVL